MVDDDRIRSQKEESSLSDTSGFATSKSLHSASREELSDSINTALLYSDTDISKGCTHTIPWDANILIGLQKCPITMEPVGMVCDGLVASVEKENRDKNNNGVHRIVRFKFGKKIYQLTTIGEKTEQQKTQQDPLTTGWFEYFSGTKSATTKDNCITTTMLAQKRIAQALNLASLKILHKGKVVYPPPQCSEPMQETSISLELLRISDEHWFGSRNNNRKKVALVVMGTSKDGHLKESSKNSQGYKKKSIPQLLQQSIWFPVRIFSWSLQMSWHLVTSFFAPFLPSYLLGGEGDGRNSIGNGNTEHSRPHQD